MMSPIMKYKPIIVVFLLLVLVVIVVLHGCGNSSSSDPCSTGTAPFGAKMVALTADQTSTVVSAPAALSAGPFCITNVSFLLLDPNLPMNGLWTRINTEGLIADTQTPPLDCTSNTYSTSSLLRKTSTGGTVNVDFLSGIISKPTPTATDTTVDYIVRANSCSAGASTKISIKVTWTP